MSFNSSEVRLHALDYLQVIRNRFPIILLVFCLVFVSAVAITHLMPKKYLGKVSVEIVQNDDDVRVFRNSSHPDFAALNFVNTQFEIISSPETLYRVVDELDLVKRWKTATRHEALSSLGGKIETSSRRGTNLIDISVFADTPEEAAELANSVAKNYAEKRMDDEKGRISKGLEVLQNQVAKQQEKVASAQTEMLRLMREGNIVDMAQSTQGFSNDAVSMTPSVLANSENLIFELKQKTSNLSTQLDRLNELSGDDMIKMAMSLDVADASVTQVYPQFLDQTIKMERLRSLGLGRKHPKVLALQSEIEKMREYLASGVETIRSTLATQLQIAQESLARIEGLHSDKKDQSISEREGYVDYNMAKNMLSEQRNLLQSMEVGLNQKKVEMNMTSTPIRIHETAEPDPRPARPIVMLNLVLGGVIGLGMGLGLAFFLEYLDTTVKSIDQVEELLDTKVLAVIPKGVGILMNNPNSHMEAEAYRILRTNLEFSRTDPRANVITGVSGSPGEGKSTTISNLAYVTAQGGYTTLLIDADMRRPSLHRHFGTANSPGLSNFLVGETRIEDAVLRTRNQNLWFLPSGGLPTDPAGLLNSRAMVDMIADMKRRFDFVFIDSPPILGVSDASVIASEADMTMVIVQQGKLPEKTLQHVKQGIESAGGNLVGVVMNNVDVRSDSQYSYYTSYYSYYATPQGPTVDVQPQQRQQAQLAEQQEQALQQSQPSQQSQLQPPVQHNHQPPSQMSAESRPQVNQPAAPANDFAVPTQHHPQYPAQPQQQQPAPAPQPPPVQSPPPSQTNPEVAQNYAPQQAAPPQPQYRDPSSQSTDVY